MNATPDAPPQPAQSQPAQSQPAQSQPAQSQPASVRPASVRPAAAPASPLPAVIDELWDRRAELTPADSTAAAQVVGAVDLIDSGLARVAWVTEAGGIAVDERAKGAILLASR